VSLSGLGRVWSYLGSLLALYAAGTWIILQGGKSFAELPGLEGRAPVTSAYEAVLIVGLLLGFLSAVGIIYMRKSQGNGQSLLPVVAIADTGPHNVNSWSMRVYQGFFVLIFLFLPAISLYKLNGDVIRDGVLWHNDDPALGSIALKNAFAWKFGKEERDAKEHDCRVEVARAEGFTWLANRRCDIVKAEGLKPFDKVGPSTAQNTDDVIDAPLCVRDLAKSRVGTDKCERAIDISEECEKSERHCRGIQWLPFFSPLAQAALTFFGWGMFVWLLLELSYRKIHALLGERKPDMLPAPDAVEQD
jgi:hypothetical protein